MVHLNRATGGRRIISSIAEITGTEGDTIAMQELFRFVQTGVTDGHAAGHFEACGVRPHLLERFKDEGEEMPVDLFQRRKLDFGTQSE